MSVNYENIFSESAPDGIEDSAVKRGKYDFAVAYPDPDTLPLDDLIESLSKALKEEGKDLAVYPNHQGYVPLREFVSQKLAKDRGINVGVDQIILGDGSGQPIHMLCEALLDSGDIVLTEDWVYSGTLNQLRRRQADIRGVTCDEDGMLPEELENQIANADSDGKQIKFIYTIPTFQNPQGWVMSLERRKSLVEIAQKHNILILEDDCYVDLRFSGDPVPTIHSLDNSGIVMYVGSFSKVIAPGMRLGYMTAPEPILKKARAVKSGGGVNQFAALAVHRFSVDYLDDHVDTINETFRAKRDAMVAALGENFGSVAKWSAPEGGLFCWVELNDKNADVKSIQQSILDNFDVGYHPGSNFSPSGKGGENKFRLCFGYNSPEEIHEGVARLAEAFEQKGIM
jgi:2-aminoadipate transaminase